MTLSTNNNIRATNQIALLLLLTASPYIYIFRLSGNPLLGWTVIPAVILFGVTIWLNRLRLFNAGRFLLVFNASLATMFFAATFGRDAGIQLLYLAYAAFPMVIFKPTEIKKIVLATIIPLTCLATLEISNYQFVPQTYVTAQYLRIVYSTAILAVPAVIILCLRFYAVLQYKTESSLMDANANLNRSNAKLKLAYDELQTTYKDLAQARQVAEKSSQLAAYATLTRGIAHEIRNPVAMARSGAEIFSDPTSDMETKEEFARCIIENLDRTLAIVSSMLRYGNASANNKIRLQLNTIIASTALLSRPRCDESHIHLQVSLGDIPPIEADAGALQQILTNLILNAVEAMETIPGPHYLHVSTRTTDSWIEISFKDTGPGIGETDQARIFDSFFTTKHDNQGLGLSIVARLVEDHGGEIKIHSHPELERGAEFIIQLPK